MPISDKYDWDSLYLYKNISQKCLTSLKGTQNSSSPSTQCCDKPEKAVSGSIDEEQAVFNELPAT